MKEIASRIEQNKRTNQEYTVYYMDNSKEIAPPFRIDFLPEINATHSESIQEMHTHGFYVVLWFTHGTGKHVIDFEEYDIKPNTMFFLPPNRQHKFIDIKSLKGYNIMFNEEFLFKDRFSSVWKLKHELFFRHDLKPYCLIPDENVAGLQDIINALLHELNTQNEDASHTDYLYSLYTTFLITVKRCAKWDEEVKFYSDNRSTSIYLKFRELVEEHFYDEHEVKKYAEMLHLSTKSLSSHVLEASNMQPLSIINNRIITEAKRMLQYTPMTVKEISTILGFDDASYFNKLFKRLANENPADFRLRVQQKWQI